MPKDSKSFVEIKFDALETYCESLNKDKTFELADTRVKRAKKAEEAQKLKKLPTLAGLFSRSDDSEESESLMANAPEGKEDQPSTLREVMAQEQAAKELAKKVEAQQKALNAIEAVLQIDTVHNDTNSFENIKAKKDFKIMAAVLNAKDQILIGNGSEAEVSLKFDKEIKDPIVNSLKGRVKTLVEVQTTIYKVTPPPHISSAVNQANSLEELTQINTNFSVEKEALKTVSELVRKDIQADQSRLDTLKANIKTTVEKIDEVQNKNLEKGFFARARLFFNRFFVFFGGEDVRKKDLEREKRKAELTSLKSQLEKVNNKIESVKSAMIEVQSNPGVDSISNFIQTRAELYGVLDAADMSMRAFGDEGDEASAVALARSSFREAMGELVIDYANMDSKFGKIVSEKDVQEKALEAKNKAIRTNEERVENYKTAVKTLADVEKKLADSNEAIKLAALEIDNSKLKAQEEKLQQDIDKESKSLQELYSKHETLKGIVEKEVPAKVVQPAQPTVSGGDERKVDSKAQNVNNVIGDNSSAEVSYAERYKFDSTLSAVSVKTKIKIDSDNEFLDSQLTEVSRIQKRLKSENDSLQGKLDSLRKEKPKNSYNAISYDAAVADKAQYEKNIKEKQTRLAELQQQLKVAQQKVKPLEVEKKQKDKSQQTEKELEQAKKDAQIGVALQQALQGAQEAVHLNSKENQERNSSPKKERKQEFESKQRMAAAASETEWNIKRGEIYKIYHNKLENILPKNSEKKIEEIQKRISALKEQLKIFEEKNDKEKVSGRQNAINLLQQELESLENAKDTTQVKEIENILKMCEATPDVSEVSKDIAEKTKALSEIETRLNGDLQEKRNEFMKLQKDMEDANKRKQKDVEKIKALQPQLSDAIYVLDKVTKQMDALKKFKKELSDINSKIIQEYKKPAAEINLITIDKLRTELTNVPTTLETINKAINKEMEEKQTASPATKQTSDAKALGQVGMFHAGQAMVRYGVEQVVKSSRGEIPASSPTKGNNGGN